MRGSNEGRREGERGEIGSVDYAAAGVCSIVYYLVYNFALSYD
jgi:hypothetical protein